ncbi:hypothetical protein FRC07_004129 [Ceratobasidium sp. 392]|nr:hypothetical protein FRC07_004129 [Ceratobasidium sp. 392]
MNSRWEKRDDLKDGPCYVRHMTGAESILDQVHQLQNGHDQFAFGATFSGQMTQPELESRLLNALVRLRYTCPIVSASPAQNIHDPELRSWVYTPIKNLQEAKDWANAALRTNTAVAQSNPEAEICNLVERPLGTRELFEVHLVGPYVTGQYTLFVYASHALLEGQSMIALFRQLFSWVVSKDLKVEPELQLEDSQVQRLEPSAFFAFGGLPPRWNEECPAFFKELAATASIEMASAVL